MIQLPPTSTLTVTLFPYPTLYRSEPATRPAERGTDHEPDRNHRPARSLRRVLRQQHDDDAQVERRHDPELFELQRPHSVHPAHPAGQQPPHARGGDERGPPGVPEGGLCVAKRSLLGIASRLTNPTDQST